jgi:hypothetical protein
VVVVFTKGSLIVELVIALTLSLLTLLLDRATQLKVAPIVEEVKGSVNDCPEQMLRLFGLVILGEGRTVTVRVCAVPRQLPVEGVMV